MIRLREKGCRVCGIGQKGKTGDETVGVYDAFTDLAHHGVRQMTESASTSAFTPVPSGVRSKTPARASRVKAAPVPPAAAFEVPPKPAARALVKTAAKTAARPDAKPAARTAGRKSTAATAPAAPRVRPAVQAPSEAVEFILQAVPALRSGNDVALNDVAQALRLAGLLGKHGSSLKLFDKLTAEFAVLLHPDRIRWTAATTS